MDVAVEEVEESSAFGTKRERTVLDEAEKEIECLSDAFKTTLEVGEEALKQVISPKVAEWRLFAKGDKDRGGTSWISKDDDAWKTLMSSRLTMRLL